MIKFCITLSWSLLTSCVPSYGPLPYSKLESPNPASVESVQFLFFKPDDVGKPHAVKDPLYIKPEDFNPQKKTVVIIHGFGDFYPGSYIIPALVQAYSTRGNRNIIVVEWGALAASPYYLTAARNTYAVGELVAGFLSTMIGVQGLSMKLTEMIGFSLGAHVAGVASSLLVKKPRRIIGLDPAELLFSNSPTEFILDNSDAPLVEVIHSSGGHIGFKRPLGHRDFYPNGGTHPQPGCTNGLAATACSHRRAYQYFAEAVTKNGRGFKATQCSSMKSYLNGTCKGNPKVLMANRNYDSTLNGSFYLITNPKKPYGLT